MRRRFLLRGHLGRGPGSHRLSVDRRQARHLHLGEERPLDAVRLGVDVRHPVRRRGQRLRGVERRVVEYYRGWVGDPCPGSQRTGCCPGAEDVEYPFPGSGQRDCCPDVVRGLEAGVLVLEAWARGLRRRA